MEFLRQNQLILLFYLLTTLAFCESAFAENTLLFHAKRSKKNTWLVARKMLPTQKININKATFEDFTQLPRIGKKLAARIMRVRKELGGKFESIRQLTRVRGIGSKTLHRLKPYVYVGVSAQRTLHASKSIIVKKVKNAQRKKRAWNCYARWLRSPKTNKALRVAVNFAGQKLLQKLPCIGKKKALAIMQMRLFRGPFLSVKSLERVHGISKKTANWVANHITFKANLNKITLRQIESIKVFRGGLGAAILKYRSRRGSFRRIRDVVRVRGLGYSNLNLMKKLFFVPKTSHRVVSYKKRKKRAYQFNAVFLNRKRKRKSMRKLSMKRPKKIKGLEVHELQ